MPETTEIMRNRPLNHMKDNMYRDGLKVVLRTADAYADQINMEKNMLPICSNKIKILISELHELNAAVMGNAASVFNSIKGN